MDEAVVLGKTPEDKDVVLSYEQRRQHTYVIGVNGTGKSALLRHIAFHDLRQTPKHGLCVIDPHGDLIDDIISLVPEDRVDDVILFNPADEENPFCLNLFTPVPSEEIPRVASEIVSIFRKIFGRNWTPEVEGVIQNVTLTLLARPADYEFQKVKPWVAAMDEIPALLAMESISEEDREKPPWKRKVDTYRNQFYQLLQQQDQIPVWEFWNYNFDTLTPRPRSELTLAVLNQVRRFLANPIVRNIVAQTESKLDLSQVMKDGRILLVNLSKGRLGEANSAFLGSVIVAKLVVAVFARAKVEQAEERTPFHIIVDEFQNFAISSFPVLLSEGRKYNVDLVIAHQYREQLRDWVQGATVNAGNIITFRLGGDDALELAREFDATPPPPEFDFKPRYRQYSGLGLSINAGEQQILDGGNEAAEILAKGDLNHDWDRFGDVRNWLRALARYSKDDDSAFLLEVADRHPLKASEEELQRIEERFSEIKPPLLEQRRNVTAYLQERTLYTHAPGSKSSGTGAVYDRVPGRSRLYSDVYQEIANELTHLPNFHARCRLSGSASAPVERTFHTVDWPEGQNDATERKRRYDSNVEAIRANTRRDFTRPKKKVEQEFRHRYELMLRSIGMSWSPDEPLPKPQVLLESED
jgi:hypothetical protein